MLTNYNSNNSYDVHCAALLRLLRDLQTVEVFILKANTTINIQITVTYYKYYIQYFVCNYNFIVDELN